MDRPLSRFLEAETKVPWTKLLSEDSDHHYLDACIKLSGSPADDHDSAVWGWREHLGFSRQMSTV